jgi:two-component system NtrC family response regulator
MKKDKLLIIEDDTELSTQMKWGLSEEYQIFIAEDRLSALEIIKKERPLVITLDLGLPPHPGGVEEGFLSLGEIIEHEPLIKVIIITGRHEKEHALEAIKRGVYDFLVKPIEMKELQTILRRALHVTRLEQEDRELQVRTYSDVFEKMLGTSPQIQKVFEMIRKVAATEASVLIIGESGTGKELSARAIHQQGLRREGPFITINCAAIPDTLLESELFGHEKGAFTGAHIQRKGRIESAEGGTLFLDEIGDLSLRLQAKLLRFLQEQRIERIGGREEIFIDARVIAATNIDIKEALRKQHFREDLYYRLSIVKIALPPLRERDSDVLILAKAFLQKYSLEIKKRLMAYTPQALRAIELYSWPGNIRELKNRIKRAVIMANDTKVTIADLELSSKYAEHTGQSLKDAREVLEREMIQCALARNKGNLTRTASELCISRPSLYGLLDKLGIARK